jgi:gamma-glutamylcyclotransferase (GGCT)/AIG2-like uncharacterized protein YtfP
MKLLAYIATACILVLVPCRDSSSQTLPPNPIQEQIQWGQYLESHDLKWDRLPRNWKEAPFLGNGEQGTMMYQLGPRKLRWDVGCSAAHDHRPFEQDDFSEKNVTVLNRGRHFIGHLELRATADLTGGGTRLMLWDAEAKGTLRSSEGEAQWRTFVHANHAVMYFEIEAKGDLAGSKFVYVPAEAKNPRAVRAKTPRIPANPPAEMDQLEDQVKTAVHNLDSGGQTAVAWVQKEADGKRQLWLSVQHSFPSNDAVTQAVEAVRRASQADQDQWVEAHQQWWHEFYPASYVSTGDPFWDSFYWVQQYKLASATRDRGWILDNQGPWLQPTAWNAIWWNLNAQIAHSEFATANRRNMGSALSHRLHLCRENLIKNVAEPYRADSSAIGRNSSGWDLLGQVGQPGTGRPPMDPNIGRECGNLLWALHNVDLEYRYWKDEELRDRVLYPLLVRAVNYYRHFLKEEADGRLHLPETYSPEYRRATDCTYDLDLLRWGVGRLLELAKEKKLEASTEPLIEEWREIQNKLVPVYTNETGRMIGRNVALKGGHRHWSHLLAIYPLRTLTPDAKEDRELIQRSLTHWHSAKRPLAGYSVTGGSCMASLLGDGDQSLNFLNRLKPFLHKNTFYSEAGGLPVIETPLHGATAMQEMLLQSWGGRLRVFPAIPSTWPDVQFHRLRCEGAYLVSARREKGKVRWVHVQAEFKGEVEVDPGITDADWLASEGVQVSKNEQGVYTVTMLPESWVLFWPEGDAQPKPIVEPVPRRGKNYRFGL